MLESENCLWKNEVPGESFVVAEQVKGDTPDEHEAMILPPAR